MITAKITAVEEVSRKLEGLHLGLADEAFQVLDHGRAVAVVVVVLVATRRRGSGKKAADMVGGVWRLAI